MQTYYIVSNLFGRNGCLDLGGDEEEVNRSAKSYRNRTECSEAAESLARRYPNAQVDIIEGSLAK